MCTVENRTLYERKGGRYPSDLTDAEWALIGPMIPPAKAWWAAADGGPSQGSISSLAVDQGA